MEEIADEIGVDVGSFTLEDALDNLKDIQAELEHEIDELVNHMTNNRFDTLMEFSRQDEIKNRHHKLMRGLLKNLHRQEPRILPHANTIDLHKTIIQDFTTVTRDMEEIVTSLKNDLEKTRKNIAYLKNNKAGLEKMTNACLGAIENVATHTTYRKEIEITKNLFNKVKADLYTCVDTIFPDDLDFKTLLADFTQAYLKGGDEVFISIAPENITFVKFLVEADLAVYHRNDKSKIKMTDLL